jgi:PAS domain S-box-containing protein
VTYDGTMTFVNDYACHFWGLSRNELLGALFVLNLHQNDSDQTHEVIYNMLHRKQEIQGLLNHQKTPQGWRAVEWNMSPVYENGIITGFIATGRDVSDWKEDEERLQQLMDIFDNMIEPTYKILKEFRENYEQKSLYIKLTDK